MLLSRLTQALCAGSIVNIAPYIHHFTFDTFVEIIYGEPLCPKPYTETLGSRNAVSAIKGISKYAWGAGLLPWLGWLMSTRPMVFLSRRPTYDKQGNLTGIAALADHTRDVILAHPERALQSDQPSIMKNWLQVPESDAKHMVPHEVWRECFNLIFAGPGSTAAALTSTVYELGTVEGREWQARIRSELSAENFATASPTLVAVLKETMRVHAPFPTSFPRSIAPGAETAIPELSAPLPVGTVVSANSYILGRSKEIWGDDADLWKPERWLDAEGEKKKLDDKFVAFSKGPRGCVGKELAMMVLAKAVAGILGQWDVTAEGLPKGGSFLEMQYEECNVTLENIGGNR